MKWLTLPAALVALVFGSEANAANFSRFSRTTEGEIVESAPIHADAAPIVTNPAPAGGCCGNSSGPVVGSAGCASGGCGAGGRMMSGCGAGGGGYLGFSWATGCCDRPSSCCDGIWDGFCAQQKNWCNRGCNFGCNTGGCYSSCGSCYGGCGTCRPMGCGSWTYRTRGFGFGTLMCDDCNSCASGCFHGGCNTGTCATGNCGAVNMGAPCANGDCQQGHHHNNHLAPMPMQNPVPVPVPTPAPEAGSEARGRMPYPPMPVNNQVQPRPTGKTASRPFPSYYYQTQPTPRTAWGF